MNLEDCDSPDRLPHYAFIIVAIGDQLDELCSFSGSLPY